MKLSRVFIAIAAGICFLAMAVLILSINRIMEREITTQYEEKADMLLFSMKAVRSHIGSVVRPEATKLLDPDDFVVELQSTSYAANRVFDAMPDDRKYEIVFRTPSTKPMNPGNRATPVEEELIRILDGMHRSGDKDLEWRGIRSVDGVDHYIIAQGAVNRASCLPCHSQPEDAPLSMQQRYSFDYPPRLENRVETAEVVYIPMSSIYATIKNANQFLFVLGAVGLMTIILAVYLLFSKMISNPLGRLRSYTLAVEQGSLDTEIKGTFRGELASLKAAVQGMVQKLKEKIREAEDKSREAETESQRAMKAVEEAQESKRRAEQARVEGMNHAAGSVENIVDNLTGSLQELSSQVKHSASSAQSQNERVAESSTAMEQMNATVLEVSRNASNVAERADESREKALNGSEIVQQAVEAIMKVQKQADSLRTNLGGLGDEAEGISKIMNVIDDIADQTNLLALNAAIEAARAGEAGRGFAVVADEVRKLAEKTMNATKEVSEAISSIQAGTKSNIQAMEGAVLAVQEATDLARKSGQALEEIVTLVSAAADDVRSIATATEEQSASSDQINVSLEEISRLSSDTAEVMNRSEMAISQLLKQVHMLQELVREMKEEA
ncbi:methyl-accepting chemotaxis protein [Desulfonatronovibrio hydrogenovorans]|uniref:methyl-accepting chemotaxis protein n=1 Tax=Desulfonatronovibrio hydrogenovorans TaxID=53245 RepID=UPI00048F1125|nr:methyl-accepting chemotaxis protein [Desulfonatronovibrio hydrogenovorans]